MRLGFVYAAHGVIHSEWKPRQTGRQYELPPNLQPLEGVRDHFNIFTNLSHLEADSKGDGSGDHNRAAGAWLGLLATLGMFVGGMIAMRDERRPPAARHTDLSGAPVDSRPEVETHPAPRAEASS